ncbi:MAG: DNA polymerase thumb domain-containing protein [Christensenellales bacterium]
MDKVILHCDANNFYASVACMLDKSLQGKCVAVSGDPTKRHGIILAKNQRAKEMGVKTGDVIWEAKKKCPSLVLVAPQYDMYVKYSDILFDIYTQYTDRVEPFGIDECWLDVTHSLKLFGSGQKIADTLRERIKNEVGITISVGVSFNKIFAKLGSDMKKPDATTIISRENYRQKTWGLPVSDMIMIGRKTCAKLELMGIKTLGDLANTNVKVLKNKFGINGEKMYLNANGIGEDEVRLYYQPHIPKSISNSTTMPKDVTDMSEISAVITALSEMVAVRMRKYDFEAGGVGVAIRYNDFSGASQQSRLVVPTSNAGDIRDNALKLLVELRQKDKPIRALTVFTWDLDNGGQRQMSLFDDPQDSEKKNRLDKTIDGLRKKYGYNVVQSARVMEHPYICHELEDSEFKPFKK